MSLCYACCSIGQKGGGMLKGWVRYRRYIAPVHDVFVAALSLPLAVGLRVGFDDLPIYAPQLVYTVPAFCGIAAVCFHQSRMYRGLWRYSSLGDLQAVARGVLAAVLVFIALMFVVDRMQGLPRTVPVIQTLVLLVILGASRFTRRVLREGSATRMQKPDNTERWLIPILLVGAEHSATMLIRRLASGDSREPFRVVGILDFNNENVGRTVMSVPILGTIDTFEAVLERLTARGQRPQKVVLTRTISGQRMRELRTLADKAQISLVRLPRLVEFEKIAENGKIEFRPIVLEDLLRRPAVTLNQQAIERMIEGRRIVITGAGGSIGSELSRQIARRRPGELVLLDVSEFNLYMIDREIGELSPSVARRSVLLDIRDRASIEHLFDTCRPEIVFHAAALKHVPLLESNPIEGVRTNTFGTRNVADAARQCGAETFVQISTDKAVRPTCVMGAAKRLAESYCQALDRARRLNGDPATRFVIVRFGNVLGSRGSVIPLFVKQLQHGGPLTVTDPNVTRFFMTIGEAVELVLQASGSGMPAGEVTGLVHVLDMGEPVRIVELAEHMIRLAGFRPNDEIKIEFTGLRPGEKLHEELFYPAEKAVENGVPGVFVVRSKGPELGALARAFSRLEYACAVQDEAAVKRQLKRIVLSTIDDAEAVEGALNWGTGDCDPRLQGS